MELRVGVKSAFFFAFFLIIFFFIKYFLYLYCITI